MGNQGITGVSGNDILNINGTIITGHADGDAFKLEPNGDISQYKVSKDGNSIIALQYTGILCKLTVRLIRACADDIALNGLLQAWIGSPNTFSLLPAENASGNYTKVVQRIPVKIALDPHPGRILKAGSSVTIKIRVR